jgi:hypothetical protein
MDAASGSKAMVKEDLSMPACNNKEYTSKCDQSEVGLVK